MILTYIVEKNKYETVNQVLKNEFKISSRLLHKLINSNQIFLNSNSIDTRSIVKENDVIVVDLDFVEESENIISQKMDLNIIYEDDAILAINKPAGIAIHPSILHYSDSLANGVKYYLESIGLKRKIRPINRLDLNTSGLVIFAKNEYVQECLIQQMNKNIFKKEYLAIVDGIFDKDCGTINLKIDRKENSIIKRCISENGQSAITHYKVIKALGTFSLVKCTLETGRTHQIRLHMSAIGHPLLGDTLYGIESDLINRQALHSYKMNFIHPITNKKVELFCDLPNDMKKVAQ